MMTFISNESSSEQTETIDVNSELIQSHAGKE
jgi:hypothetical protein